MRFSREYFWELVTKKSFWAAFFGLVILLASILFQTIKVWLSALVLSVAPIALLGMVSNGALEPLFTESFFRYAPFVLWLLTLAGVVYVVKKGKWYKAVASIIILVYLYSLVFWLWYW